MLATQSQAYRGILPDSLLAASNVDRMAAHYADRLAQTLQQGGCWYVAEAPPGQVIAFASGGPNREGPPTYDGELYNLFVLPACQGRKIGTALFLEVVSFLQAKNYASLLLWSIRGTQAGDWYKSLGGELIAERPETIATTPVIMDCYGWPDLAALAGLLASKIF